MVNREEAQAFLAARFGHDVRGLAPVARQGEWSHAFAFHLGAAERIIRFSALDEDFRKDLLAVRFAAPGLPVPAILEIGEAFGGFYAISARAPGGFLDDLDGAGMREMLPSLFAALDAARQADLAGTTGYGMWSSDGHAPHATWRDALLAVADDLPGARTHGWRERLCTSPTGSEPFARAYAALRELLRFCPDERYLVHSDLLNFNVLVADGRISAVIDWGCSLYGDFLYDLAWFCVWAPWHPAWHGIDFASEAAGHYETIGLAVPHFAERLRACQIHIGLDGMAYNAFKERWPNVDEIARRTLAVANRS